MNRNLYNLIVILFFNLFIAANSFSQTETAPTGSGTSGDPYIIQSIGNLAWLQDANNNKAWGTYIKQTADIDASTSSGWNSGKGLSPIGSDAIPFSGTYDGNGYTISGLSILRDSIIYTAMFGYISNATIENLGLVNANIIGGDYTGGLVGFVSNSHGITSCFISGSVKGGNYVGGIAGFLDYTPMNKCFCSANIIGSGQRVGGLVGNNDQSQINACYTSGSVFGGSYVGGLVGDNVLSSTIINTYSIVSVSSNGKHVGGLVGYNYQSSISTSYSAGIVSSTGGNAGGLIGDTSGLTLSSSFWDTTASGRDSSMGGVGLSTLQMKTKSTFINANWDFSSIWSISSDSNSGYPYLVYSQAVQPPDTNVIDSTVKYPGFIGFYNNDNGTVYGGWGIPPGEQLQRAFNFANNTIIDENSYMGFTFQQNLDSNITSWDANVVYGIVRPPSESGVVNAPADTALYNPFAAGTTIMPGMIQAAHRFSELSKIYPQVRGIIIDDFFNDYTYSFNANDVLEIRDALKGKAMLSSGLVDHNSKATTPNLKLFVVIYQSKLSGTYLAAEKSADTLVDGLDFFIALQNENYAVFNTDINYINQLFPGKEVMAGVYLDNSDELMTPPGINYVMSKSIDLYDQGRINGIHIFSGYWLASQNISQARWQTLAIPQLLDSLYYPYLGKGTGKVLDVNGNPEENAIVTVERIINGDTLVVTEKYTNSLGTYDFGAWAGKDSAITYEIFAKDSSNAQAAMSVKLTDLKEITLPDLHLQAAATGVQNDNSTLPSNYNLNQNYPNPFNPSTVISYSIPKESNVTLKIYNSLGQLVSTIVNKMQAAGNYQATFNADDLSSGIYFYSLSAGDFMQVKKMILLK